MIENHAPRIERLERRVWHYAGRLDDTEEKIGGGNPYNRCKYCGRSVPEISYRGHFKGCEVPGLEKQLAHFEKLLEEEKKDPLKSAQKRLRDSIRASRKRSLPCPNPLKLPPSPSAASPFSPTESTA